MFSVSAKKVKKKISCLCTFKPKPVSCFFPFFCKKKSQSSTVTLAQCQDKVRENRFVCYVSLPKLVSLYLLQLSLVNLFNIDLFSTVKRPKFDILFGENIFFCKIFLGDPPLNFLDVCLKFRPMER
jgi:hypothetical protein